MNLACGLGGVGPVTTTLEWLASRLGRSVDVDGAYGPQCVDLVNDYLEVVRGAGRVAGNAIDIPHDTIAGMEWRPNDIKAIPRTGSIVCWHQSSVRVRIGLNGHVAVCLMADLTRILSVDQNWNGVQHVTLEVHSYAAVTGWHHPI